MVENKAYIIYIMAALRTIWRYLSLNKQIVK